MPGKAKTGWEFYRVEEHSKRPAITAQRWRWRYRAANGRITKASTESFVRKIDCIASARASGFVEPLPRVTAAEMKATARRKMKAGKR